MLNKIKKMFMKKEKDLQVENNPPSNHQTSEEAIQEEFEVLEEQSRAREEALMAAENIDSVPEPEESDNINTEEGVTIVGYLYLIWALLIISSGVTIYRNQNK